MKKANQDALTEIQAIFKEIETLENNQTHIAEFKRMTAISQMNQQIMTMDLNEDPDKEEFIVFCQNLLGSTRT